jgi:hypothetical protein
VWERSKTAFTVDGPYERSATLNTLPLIRHSGGNILVVNKNAALAILPVMTPLPYVAVHIEKAENIWFQPGNRKRPHPFQDEKVVIGPGVFRSKARVALVTPGPPGPGAGPAGKVPFGFRG